MARLAAGTRRSYPAAGLDGPSTPELVEAEPPYPH
jgi:hypothetical protein